MFQRLQRSFKAFAAEFSKPESFVKGEAFEAYVRKVVFPLEMYCLEHKTPSYLDNKEDYIESSLLPDFGFRCRESGYRFYVEAKFRRGFYYQDPTIECCTWEQLQRYRDIDRERPVFLCLGLGSNPSKPKELLLIPMVKIHATALDHTFLDRYTFYPDKAAISSYLKVLLLKR